MRRLRIIPDRRFSSFALDQPRCLCVHVIGYMGTPSGPRSGPEAAQDIADRYLARGSSFSSGLPGAWAAVIEDGASGRIVLAQDPLGIETIYFRKEAGELIVAAEALPLVAGSPPDAVC